jgi:hypothetical protein
MGSSKKIPKKEASKEILTLECFVFEKAFTFVDPLQPNLLIQMPRRQKTGLSKEARSIPIFNKDPKYSKSDFNEI